MTDDDQKWDDQTKYDNKVAEEPDPIDRADAEDNAKGPAHEIEATRNTPIGSSEESLLRSGEEGSRLLQKASLETEPAQVLEIPQLTIQYHRSRTLFVLFSGLLGFWELLGCFLKDGFLIGKVVIKHQSAVPWLLLLVSLYFALRVLVEWYQSDERRRRQRASRIDLSVVFAIWAMSIAVFSAQQVSGIDLIVMVRNDSNLWATGLMSSSAALVLCLVLRQSHQENWSTLRRVRFYLFRLFLGLVVLVYTATLPLIQGWTPFAIHLASSAFTVVIFLLRHRFRTWVWMVDRLASSILRNLLAVSSPSVPESSTSPGIDFARHVLMHKRRLEMEIRRRKERHGTADPKGTEKPSEESAEISKLQTELDHLSSRADQLFDSGHMKKVLLKELGTLRLFRTYWAELEGVKSRAEHRLEVTEAGSEEHQTALQRLRKADEEVALCRQLADRIEKLRSSRKSE